MRCNKAVAPMVIDSLPLDDLVKVAQHVSLGVSNHDEGGMDESNNPTSDTSLTYLLDDN